VNIGIPSSLGKGRQRREVQICGRHLVKRNEDKGRICRELPQSLLWTICAVLHLCSKTDTRKLTVCQPQKFCNRHLKYVSSGRIPTYTAVDSRELHQKHVLMLGFKPRTCGPSFRRSPNWPTQPDFYQNIHFKSAINSPMTHYCTSTPTPSILLMFPQAKWNLTNMLKVSFKKLGLAFRK